MIAHHFTTTHGWYRQEKNCSNNDNHIIFLQALEMSYIFLCTILRLLKMSYLTQCLCGQSHFIPMFWQITLLAISCLFEALLLESKISNKLLTFFNTSKAQRICIPSNRQYIGHLFTTTMCPSSQIHKHELKAILTLCLFCLHEGILTCLLLGHAFFFICHLYFSQKKYFERLHSRLKVSKFQLWGRDQ